MTTVNTPITAAYNTNFVENDTIDVISNTVTAAATVATIYRRTDRQTDRQTCIQKI